MTLLIVEFLILYVALPLGYRFSRWKIQPLPLLWFAALYCWWTMRRAHLQPLRWGWEDVQGILLSGAVIFVIIAACILYGIWRYIPDALFELPRRRPLLWAVLMLLYPVFSVIPQGIIYRAFLIERYAALFPNQWLMVAVSATAFGFMHLVFRNWVAVGLTAFGGILFAYRFQQTGSLAASSLEHALYGCLLFTAGLGRYIYHGTAHMAEAVVEAVEEA